MKKISYKKILLIILLMVIIASISTMSFASLIDIKPTPGPGGEQIKRIASQILGIVQVIAMAVAVIMLVVLSIKYMTAAPSEKADLKKSFLIYVVGVLILLAGATILNIIQALANDINNGPSSSQVSSGTWT